VGIGLAALILLELAGRWAGMPALPPDPAFVVAREWCYPDQVDKDRDLLWRYRPDQIIRGGFVPPYVYTINAHGFRTPDFAAVKPEGTQRVVCLGGSTTFGWGVSDGTAYPRQLETKLNELDLEGRHWEVINLGMSNYSTWQGLRLARQVLPELDPDVVFINFSWADHQPASQGVADADIEMPAAGWLRFESTLNRSALARWTRRLWRLAFSVGPQVSGGVTAWRVSPAQFASNVESICWVARQAGARAVVVTSPISTPPRGYSDAEGIFHYHHQYRRMARYAATMGGGEFIEMANAFDAHPEFFGSPPDDFEHFSAQGHVFAGEFLARFLLGRLREQPQTTP